MTLASGVGDCGVLTYPDARELQNGRRIHLGTFLPLEIKGAHRPRVVGWEVGAYVLPSVTGISAVMIPCTRLTHVLLAK